MTLLLTTCAALLGACTLLAWLYLSAVTGDINSSVVAKNNSSVVAKNEIETGSALLAVKEQQVLSNLKLDAIRDELQALNEKAASASSVTPPRAEGSQ